MPAKGHKIIVNCYTCGKPLERHPWRIKRSGERQFCNKECFYKQRGMDKTAEYAEQRILVKCGGCGAELSRTPYEVKTQSNHFCNYKCMGKWQAVRFSGEQNPKRVKPIAVKCAGCGQTVLRTPYKAKTNRNHFCSRQCRAVWDNARKTSKKKTYPSRTPGIYYGPNFWEQRKKAMKRDGHSCRLCGELEGNPGVWLDAHHIVRFSKFGYVKGQNDNYKAANKLSNLVILCRKCHRKAERNPSLVAGLNL